MNGNDQYLENIERQWGNFDPPENDIYEALGKQLSHAKAIAKSGDKAAQDIQAMAEREQERADELRDSMREDGIGGY
jgi:hypothetical protein